MKADRILIMLVLVLLLGLAGCGPVPEKNGGKQEDSTSIEDMNPENIDDITMEGMVDDVLKRMTLEEKVGQMFIVSTDSLDFNAERGMTDQMKKGLNRLHPGGIVFFSFNIENRKQIRTFIKKIQATNKDIPLFMAVDEEGGKVARLANTKGMKMTTFPPMSYIGDTGDPDEAYKVGSTIGQEIHELGFNLDFAPVADVMTNNANTEIGNRSFGSDPEVVSSMVSQVVKGLQENGVSATVKHFPGQGDTAEDTHKGYVDLETTINRLRKVEFLPFEEGIKEGADMVMVSHVSVSQITGRELPASLSDLIVSDILKNELGFENAVITDALNMKGITKFYDADEAAIMAIQAGDDILLMPDDFEAACKGVIEAVKDGSLEEEKIDRAVARILKVKIRRGILPLDSDYFRNK